jgi:hypothetical protein
MKHEEKVAVATGAAVMLIAGPIAAMINTPVIFGTLALGTYKIAKAAYEKAKPPIKSNK